jgi:hypothetical protein
MSPPANPATQTADLAVREAIRRLFAAQTRERAFGDSFVLAPFTDGGGCKLLLLRARAGGAWQTIAAFDLAGTLYVKALQQGTDFVAAGWNP